MLVEIILLVYGESEIWTKAVWPRFIILITFSSLTCVFPKKDGNTIRTEWEGKILSQIFLLESESILVLNSVFAQGGI